MFWHVFCPWQAHMGQITMTFHNYRSRQGHNTLTGVNPSSGFRDMCSAKSGPNLWQIWQIFGRMSIREHNFRPRQLDRTLNGENPSSGLRDMGSASLAAFRPPAQTLTTIALQPGRLRGKIELPELDILTVPTDKCIFWALPLMSVIFIYKVLT